MERLQGSGQTVQFRFEKARPEDLVEWSALRDALYTGVSPDFHTADMELFLAASDRQCWIARDAAGAAAGFLEVALRNIVDGCLTSPVGFIEGVYVKPQYRGCGLGARLVDLAGEWALGRGCSEMATDAELENTSAQAFHRHMGFEETYRIVEFKKTIE